MSKNVFVALRTKLNFCTIKKYLCRSRPVKRPQATSTCNFHTQTQYIMCSKKNRFLLLAAFLLAAFGLQAQMPCTLDVQVAPPANLSCQNPSVQLETSVTPSGNYFYDWFGPAQLPNMPNPVVTVAGMYVVSVFDSLGLCFGGDTIFVNQDGSIPQLSITQTGGGNCNGTRTLNAVSSPGNPNDYTYLWSNGETSSSITASPGTPGAAETYCVTATNGAGCSVTRCITLAATPPIAVQINYFDAGLCVDSIGMWATAQGGQFPYAYQWNNGVQGSWQPAPAAGTYIVTVTDANGCTAVNTLVVENNGTECAHIEGFVWADWNTDCIADPGDDGLSGIPLRFTDGAGAEYFSYTTTNGFYRVQLLPGTYTVEVFPPNHLWLPCQASFTLSVGQGETVAQDFFLQPEAICPALTVDLSTPFLRRCFSGFYCVRYCNDGTQEAQYAYIEIQIDPFLTVVGATIPFENLGNNLFRFQLGDVPFNTCDYFSIQLQVSCDASLGQTHCTEAVIYPTGSCEPSNAQWSGASLQIEAECKADSIEFTVRNVGVSVSDALEYVIIEDAVMLMQAPPPTIFLDPGAVHIVKVPANGATWRMEVEQEPFHPGFSTPSQTVEGCVNGANFSIGFVNQFAFDDNDAWVDIDCTPNIGAYDPNDKQGFPIGYGAARQIEPGTDIEYLIRFQNTGTDTAFTVVIRDTLSAWLDPATVRPGASSHPYTFDFYGGSNLKFTFDNILLPDSNTNLAGSQGFVSFKIAQKPGVPLQTDILNSAAIFFDFNEPIITNTTIHRIGKDFVTLSAWQPFRSGLELRVLPNPVAQSAVLELRGMEGLQDWQVELRDALGRPVLTDTSNGDQWRFERGNLPAGLYLLQVRANGQLLGSGKVVLR